MEGSEIIVVNKSYMLQEVEISCGEKTEKYTLHPASQLFYVPAGEAHHGHKHEHIKVHHKHSNFDIKYVPTGRRITGEIYSQGGGDTHIHWYSN